MSGQDEIKHFKLSSKKSEQNNGGKKPKSKHEKVINQPKITTLFKTVMKKKQGLKKPIHLQFREKEMIQKLITDYMNPLVDLPNYGLFQLWNIPTVDMDSTIVQDYFDEPEPNLDPDAYRIYFRQ